MDIQQWAQWKHALRQRSFVAKLSSFNASGSEHSGDRRFSGDCNVRGDRAHAAVGSSSVVCYGCGEADHFRKDCPLPNISTKECRTSGSTGHIVKACKKSVQEKRSGAGASGAGASGDLKKFGAKKSGNGGKREYRLSNAEKHLWVTL